ncbi:hypothetical protein B0H17DRAFT_1196167 [Mycena rosella]|uniref:Uncharacterized protein n=1 Tax=Mycena rosella TaxID=1033263 RepID=A0AAD7DTQ8_MYCRO|nr:hypothetical protein B0H17DRAFT_1196167 [Mycena rosella]
MAHNAEVVGAHLSDVQDGGTFVQAHLMCNMEAYSSGTEVVGAHPYNMQGGGACKVHMGKVVALTERWLPNSGSVFFGVLVIVKANLAA